MKCLICKKETAVLVTGVCVDCYNYLNNLKTGWICPACGVSISPKVKTCPYCDPLKEENDE